MSSYEALIQEAERNRKFAARLTESANHVTTFKKRHSEIFKRVTAPTVGRMESISRRMWEFSEQVRLQTLGRPESA